MLPISYANYPIIQQISMQIRIESSEKKKIVEESSHVREIQMKFLDKESSRQYSQVMEEIMKTNFRRQSQRSFPRNKSSSKNLNHDNDYTALNKTTLLDKTSEKEQRVEIQSEEKVIEEQIKKIPFKFSIKSFFIQLVVAYSVTFILLYFIRLANFPYFQMILIFAFTMSIDPWRSSNVLMLLSMVILIGNYLLNLSYFTYPSIIICYYAVMVFNQTYKKKQLFVFMIIFTIVYGMIILPAVYQSLPSQSKLSYVYVFPLMMFILRTILSYSYWAIDRTAVIFLQLPLFLTGLEYGTILTQDVSTIQFWYLLVLFTLQIMNDRTQFFLRILVSITNSCTKVKAAQKQQKNKKQLDSILAAHANGYACIHSFHLFILVYIYAELNLYTAPYSSAYSLIAYVTPAYKPIIVWLLSSVYQIMSMVLQKNCKNKMLFGFTSNKWWRSILRGFLLSLGMWSFYLGLGVGALVYQII